MGSRSCQSFKHFLFFGLAVQLMAPSLAWGKACTYAIQEDSVKLEWSGYKFTEKKAVPGTFDKIDWQQNKKSLTLKSLLESISFTVDVSSLNSNDKGRDKTLTTKFFAASKSKDTITGKVKSFDLANKTSTATITMNGVSNDTDFKVEAADQTLTWTSSISLTKHFQMAAAVKALADACGPLHTGADGKSVTWDEVGIKVVATFVETCH